MFDPRYLPDDIYYGVVDRFYNDYSMGGVIDNKCFYKAIFGDRCKQPETFACRMGGYWYDKDMKRLSDEALFQTIDATEELVLKKATDSCGGKGVTFIDRKNGSMQDMFREAIQEITGDVVVQYPLRQHSVMSGLHSESVNTVRLLSLFRNGEVKIYSAVVRIGVGGAKVDNASSGGITCGINPDGRLKACAYAANGEKFLNHPTTNAVFPDFVVPAYGEMQELVKKLHPLLPYFRNISWDIAVDQDGHPVLIEVNLRSGELDFHQLNNGPIFGDDTEEILREVFGKNQA